MSSIGSSDILKTRTHTQANTSSSFSSLGQTEIKMDVERNSSIATLSICSETMKVSGCPMRRSLCWLSSSLLRTSARQIQTPLMTCSTHQSLPNWSHPASINTTGVRALRNSITSHHNKLWVQNDICWKGWNGTVNASRIEAKRAKR